MERTIEKSIGIMLIAIGLVIIAAAIFMAYNVFIGNMNAPQLSRIDNFVIVSALPDNSPGIKLGPTKFMVTKEINRIIDIVLWCLFMTFLIVAGSRIATLGIQMLREIRVEVK